MHSESFDVWSNEFVSNIAQKDPKPKASLQLNKILGVSTVQVNYSSKLSTLSVSEVLTSSNYLNLVNCENRNFSKRSHTEETAQESLSKKNGGIFIIEDVGNYQSPLKVFRGYRLLNYLL